jgi:hypothetical protein
MKHYLLTVVFAFLSVFMANAIVIQNFETIPYAWSQSEPQNAFFVYNTNFATLQIVDNPNKSGINTSDKVVSVRVHNFNSANSGIFQICFSGTCQPAVGYPTCNDCPSGKYNRIRFKYYKAGLSDRAVDFEPWGQPPGGVRSYQVVSGNYEWEYVTFELVAASYSYMQFKVNRKIDNTGLAPVSDGDYIYIDDIEFFDSQTTLTTNPKIASGFSCTGLGNNMFNFETTLKSQTNVSVELISMDGRTQSVFSGMADGKLEIPFSVKGKGMYFVRMTQGSESPKVSKIIAQ